MLITEFESNGLKADINVRYIDNTTKYESIFKLYSGKPDYAYAEDEVFGYFTSVAKAKEVIEKNFELKRDYWGVNFYFKKRNRKGRFSGRSFAATNLVIEEILLNTME